MVTAATVLVVLIHVAISYFSARYFSTANTVHDFLIDVVIAYIVIFVGVAVFAFFIAATHAGVSGLLS